MLLNGSYSFIMKRIIRNTVKRACALIRIFMTIEEHARSAAMKPCAARKWSLCAIAGHTEHALWLRVRVQLWLTTGR